MLKMLLIICPLVFLAGFIDSVAGGGGIISIPAYLIAGLPTHVGIGSNKLSACFGGTAASIKYLKEGKVMLQVAVWSALGCIAGSSIGTRLALYLDDRTLKMVVLCAIPVVAIFMLTRKNLGSDTAVPKEMSRPKQIALSLLIGLVIGTYDGMIGPDSGTFLILLFTGLLGIDLLKASGCAKVSNWASNITSVVIYALSGNIMYTVAIPASLCSIVGGWCGARYAVKGGSAKVRKMMIVVLVLLFAKLIYDIVTAA